MAICTQTATKTYTKVDIKRVFENCMADIRMIAWRTAAIEEEMAQEILEDVQIMAEEGCLKAIHVQLCDSAGDIIRAHRYTATDGTTASERPGGNQWPRLPGGEVRIFVTVDLSQKWERAKKRLNKNWGTSSYSTDYSGLTQKGTRTFSHGGYGLTRHSYG